MTSTAYNQAGDYIPRKDADFRDWGLAFAAKIAVDPQHFGLTPQDGDTLLLWSGLYADAYQPAQSPGTRTSAVVKRKNDVRIEAERLYRRYAQRVKKHPGVTFSELLVLGIHVDDLTRTRITSPRSAPLILPVFAKQGGYIIHYADENTPTSKRRPPGAALIQIYAAISPRGTDVRRAVHIGDFSRSPIRIDLSMLPRGKGRVVTFFARWVTRKGLKGPWSEGKMMPLAGFANDAGDGGEASGGLRLAA